VKIKSFEATDGTVLLKKKDERERRRRGGKRLAV